MAELDSSKVYGDLSITGDTSLSGNLSVIGNITTSGDGAINGNKITFGNGSTIDNETDAILKLTGDGSVYIKGSGSGLAFVDGTMFGVSAGTETYGRTVINLADGKIGFGPGTATRDTFLYRDAANSLKTDGALSVVGTLSALSFNKVTITTPTTGSTLTIADGKTLTCNHSITLSGTDGKVLSIGNSMTLFASNDTSTLNIGTGGTLGSAAFTASTAYVSSTNGSLTGNLDVGGELTLGEPGSIMTIKNESGTWWQKFTTADTTDLAIHRFLFEEAQGNSTYIELFGIDGNGEAYCKGNKVWHAGNLTFGIGNSNMSRGDHTHANLVAGNGITGTTYTGGVTQTWSIASHAGTAGSVGTITVTADAVGVSLGTTSTTACAGNDSRLSNSRTPVEHGDSLHNNNKYARITFTGGTSNVGYQWNHALNSANVIFSFAPNSPETHVYYTIVDNNNVKIYLDDAPYEDIIVDVTATVADASHLTTATANLTA